MISLKILNFGWLWSQICLLTPGLCTTSDGTTTNMNWASWVCDYWSCRCGILERRDSVLSLLPVCFNSSTLMLVLMSGRFSWMVMPVIQEKIALVTSQLAQTVWWLWIKLHSTNCTWPNSITQYPLSCPSCWGLDMDSCLLVKLSLILLSFFV